MPPRGTLTPDGPPAFGMDLATLKDQEILGLDPDLGVTWVGAWTLEHGWEDTRAELEEAAGRGITPVIQLYYWGDDISPTALEDGVESELHGAWKDQEGWTKLVHQLTDRLHETLGGREAVVVVETEFNKHGVETYDPLDTYLAEKIDQVREGYPPATVVLGFGNWGRHWDTFSQAADAADLLGLQALRGSTQDSLEAYRGVVQATVEGTRRISGLFSKQVLLTDLALSTYPEPEHLEHQALTLQGFFERMDELRDAGLVGMIYRCLYDDPAFDTDNHYGQAERHWGLAKPAGKLPKPSLEVWERGVEETRQQASL